MVNEDLSSEATWWKTDGAVQGHRAASFEGRLAEIVNESLPAEVK
jgi:hypothetical protein